MRKKTLSCIWVCFKTTLMKIRRDIIRILSLAMKRSRIQENQEEVFYGNPGTGKTTVARMIQKSYHHQTFSKGHLVEVNRSGLVVAGYVGHTALKVKDVCKTG